MSRMGVELVRIAMQAYGAGDYEIALALADPMMRWDERPARPDGELAWGHDDVLAAMRERLRDWEDYRFQLEELIDAGEHGVIAVYSERGTRAESDVTLEERHAALWAIESTRLVACTIYLTRDEALRAAEVAATRGRPEAAAPSPPEGPEPRTSPEPPKPAARPKRRKPKADEASLKPGTDQWARRQQDAKRRAELRRGAQQRRAS